MEIKNRSKAKSHFHILLVFGLIPGIGLVLGMFLMILNIFSGGDEDHKKWTKRLSAVVALDTIIFVLIITLSILLTNKIIPMPKKTKGGVTQEIFSSRSAIGAFMEEENDILGVRIKKIIPGSPADTAKIDVGDIIVKVNKTEIQDYKNIRKILSRSKPGIPLKVVVYRNNRNISKIVTPVDPRALYRSNRSWNPENWNLDNIDKRQWIAWISFILVMTIIILLTIKKNRSAASSLVITLFIISASTSFSYLAAWLLRDFLNDSDFFIPLFIMLLTMMFILIFSLIGKGWMVKKYPKLFQQEKSLSVSKAIGLGVLYNYTFFFRIMIIVGFINVYIFQNRLPEMPFLFYFNDPFILTMTILMVALVGPIAEEIVFRGILFTGLRSWIKPEYAVIMSAVIFGILHIPQYGVHAVGTIWYGIVFAWLYHKTGKLFVPIILHIIINTISTVMFFLIYR